MLRCYCQFFSSEVTIKAPRKGCSSTNLFLLALSYFIGRGGKHPDICSRTEDLPNATGKGASQVHFFFCGNQIGIANTKQIIRFCNILSEKLGCTHSSVSDQRVKVDRHSARHQVAQCAFRVDYCGPCVYISIARVIPFHARSHQQTINDIWYDSWYLIFDIWLMMYDICVKCAKQHLFSVHQRLKKNCIRLHL